MAKRNEEAETGNAGESMSLGSRRRSEMDVQIGPTPGIPGDRREVHAIEELSGTVLRGREGFRFSTGRRDGRAPEFGPADASRVSNMSVRKRGE